MTFSEPSGERLYGRRRGHGLRDRQKRLLEQTLPRWRADPAALGWADGAEALWLEVGFGGGEHAEAFLRDRPGAALLAAEVYAPGLCSLLHRMVPPGTEATAVPPENLRLWDEDARKLLRALPPETLDGLVLMFPDPWPKARHAARRFVGAETIEAAARALKRGGEWRIASDHPVYQGWAEACFAAQDVFAVSAPMTARPACWPATRYEAKALAAGRTPLYWRLIRA
jgi:tRNA (guanine-N7-)-methyltransferase